MFFLGQPEIFAETDKAAVVSNLVEAEVKETSGARKTGKPDEIDIEIEVRKEEYDVPKLPFQLEGEKNTIQNIINQFPRFELFGHPVFW